MTEPALDTFRSIVGAGNVLVDADLRRGFETDWTNRYGGPCLCVVRPGTTAELIDVLIASSAHDLAVITQAGNTGLVGGGVPRAATADGRPSVVVSVTRFDQLGAVDAGAMQMTAGAGVTLTNWRRHANLAGLDTPIDFAARDSATIGGAIATNAGGSRVVRFGTMRQQVVGIKAVLANGSVVGSLAGLPKEAAGIHWPSLLAGSEGTIAVITAARLRLIPWYRQTVTALVATASLGDAVALLTRLRQQVQSLDAVEVIQPAAMRLVCTHLAATAPIAVPNGGVYVMIDCADHQDPSSQLLDVVGSAPEVMDAAITTEAPQRERLVRFRDRITEAIAAASTASGTPTFKLDVAVPLVALEELMVAAQDAADRDGSKLIAFGHLAEGNVHLNHLGARYPEQIAATVLGRVAELGGTISAEHGIGIAKTPWLHLIRSRADLAAQSAIRQALDPGNLLNPGVFQVP